VRSTDERVSAVQARSRSIQRERKRRRSITVSGISVVACFAAIFSFALYLPGAVGNSPTSTSGTSGVCGSIMASGDFLGFIVIGILAFCLGVAVTVLCIMLRERARENADDADAPASASDRVSSERIDPARPVGIASSPAASDDGDCKL
jgi:hypothetical protein